MPRLKSTKMLLMLVLIISLTLLLFNLWIDWKTDNIYSNNSNNDLKNNVISSLVTSLVNSKQKTKNTFKLIKFEKTKHENSQQISQKQSYLLKPIEKNKQKPWFMTNGTIRPVPKLSPTMALWPEESDEDRIVNQLMYLPENYDPLDKKLKTIVLYLGRGGWSDLPLGQTKFILDKCPVDRCYLSSNPNDAVDADAVFFKERFQWPKHRRPLNQIWILFLLECPLHTQLFRNLGVGVFNWTATYRHDSDIVAPYEKFVQFNQNYDQKVDQRV